MKEVVKIRLAGVSFTIAQDAFEILNAYINELREHYSSEQSCDEIVADIEERISELIMERVGKEGVVSIETVNWIISTLGRPDDIDGEHRDEKREKVVKRLFRDREHKVFGGVCSGIAAFFGLDVVWVRIIAVALLFFAFSVGSIINHLFYIHIASGWYVVLAYFLLWLIIPEAKTVNQRCAMRGESSRIDTISNKFREEAGNVSNRVGKVGSELGKVFGVAIGIVLFLIAMGGIISGAVVLFGVTILSDFNIIDIIDYVVLNIGNTFILKLLACAVYFLPFIGMLYASLQLIFKFKRPFWHPGVVIFLLWVLLCIVFVVLSIRAFSPYFGYSDDRVSNDLPKVYDTMYVKYEPYGEEGMDKISSMRPRYRTYVNGVIYSEDNDNYLYYKKLSLGKGFVFVYYPSFDVDRSDSTENHIECRMENIAREGFMGLSNYNSFNLNQLDKIYCVKDSLITLSPQMISRGKKFDGHLYNLKLTVPEKTVVMVINPEGMMFEYDNRDR